MLIPRTPCGRFNQSGPLSGPPSEWMHSGMASGSRLGKTKSCLAKWEEDWAKLAKKK